MRRVVLVLSLFGTIGFALAFALSYANPIAIEQIAREMVRIEVERRVGEKLDSLSNARVVLFAQDALEAQDDQIEKLRDAIRKDVPRRVAEVVASMLDASCECRKRLVAHAKRSAAEQLIHLGRTREKVLYLAESAYASVAQNLLREFRVFTASNGMAFALLGVVALLKRKASLQLALPALVLIGAVVVTGGMYLFNQNWLHTVVFGEYVGLAYAGYLLAVALLLGDIALNRARVTTGIANAVFSGGSAVSC